MATPCGREGALRWHCGLFTNRFYSGSQEHFRPCAGDARRRRSDCLLCRLRAVDSKVAEERHIENLQGIPARHAHHGSRYHKCGSLDVHQVLGDLSITQTGWQQEAPAGFSAQVSSCGGSNCWTAVGLSCGREPALLIDTTRGFVSRTLCANRVDCSHPRCEFSASAVRD
jgi:hypothetical protein